ncbi:hypothetical protein KY290_012764 [Solanum tuberosum]|uniref:Uncharacterized protein n=1 Tax=Solanum tuberosum TaxID=4113 RepID=A0ABQ7VJY5_SOLTU|nr:hypothetical protein KY290_012764 [Solanum tuberosum]
MHGSGPTVVHGHRPGVMHRPRPFIVHEPQCNVVCRPRPMLLGPCVKGSTNIMQGTTIAHGTQPMGLPLCVSLGRCFLVDVHNVACHCALASAKVSWAMALWSTQWHHCRPQPMCIEVWQYSGLMSLSRCVQKPATM